MRLALIGPRGAGKSCVAAILSKSLRCPVVSTDDLVEKSFGFKIPLLIAELGWREFRKAESKLLAQACDDPEDVDRLILDCGGGIVLKEANRRLLKKFDIVAFLHASPEILVERCAKDPAIRPPLTKTSNALEEMRTVLRKRRPHYRSVATVDIDTSKQTPVKTAKTILNIIRSGEY